MSADGEGSSNDESMQYVDRAMSYFTSINHHDIFQTFMKYDLDKAKISDAIIY